MTVGVIGAGISGLALTRELVDRDIDVVTFEASSEPGGVIRSREVDGRVLELGPQRLRRTPGIERLVRDLGLDDELYEGEDGQPLYVYHDGRLRVVPLSPREAITTDLLSWRGKARILYEPLTGPPREGETVDEFLVRKFGVEAARRYLGPLYSGLYGTDPDDMYVEYSLGRALSNAGIDGSILLWVARRLLDRRETPPICTFERGLGRLPEAMYEAHSNHVHLDEPVETIRETDGGYDLVTGSRTTAVDDVVLTTPADAAGSMLADVAPDAAERLERLTYNPIATVHLDSPHDGEGIGFLVPHGADLRLSGTTWNSSFLDRERVFTCYLDESSYPGLSDASDEEIGETAAEEFERVTGSAADPIAVHRIVPGMPAYDRSWTALDGLSLPDGIHVCASFAERPGIPGRLRDARRVAERFADE